MMLNPPFILILFIATVVTINKVDAQIDLQHVLQTLQQVHQNQQAKQLEQIKERVLEKREDEAIGSRFGSLGAKEVETLIQQALNNDDDEVEFDSEPHAYYKKRHGNKKQQPTDDLNVYSLLLALNNKQGDEDLDPEIVEKVISQPEPERKKKTVLKKYPQHQYYIDQLNKLLRDSYSNRPRSSEEAKKRRLRPNDLLGDYPDTVNKADQIDLNDYSKVYVILNVDAIQQSRNRNGLTDVISTLLQSSSRQKDRHEGKKDRRYKGFIVNDDQYDHRRASRDSVESKDDVDYKPKRSRSRDSGGRTPIPYIRHRGDIYEKDK